MSQSKIKIAIIGPKEGGKSTIADMLSGHRTAPSVMYKPTVGLRILENENKSIKHNVELWDVSGDLKYEKYWPAIQGTVNGFIVVFSYPNPGDLTGYIKSFPRTCQFKPSDCLAIANVKESAGKVDKRI